MAASRQLAMNEAACPVEETRLAEVNNSDPKNVMEIGMKMPPMQRARLAQFCYHRKHMRELGLRLASMCSMVELKAAFGRGAEVVYAQSRDVDATVDRMNNGKAADNRKTVTLAGAYGMPKPLG